MKPEIVAYDFGRHNSDLALSAGRILEGGSWKHQRIVVLLPSAAMLPARVALSHWNLIFPPNQAAYRMLCLGMEVGEAYRAARTLVGIDFQDKGPFLGPIFPFVRQQPGYVEPDPLADPEAAQFRLFDAFLTFVRGMAGFTSAMTQSADSTAALTTSTETPKLQ